MNGLTQLLKWLNSPAKVSIPILVLVSIMLIVIPLYWIRILKNQNSFSLSQILSRLRILIVLAILTFLLSIAMFF